MLIGEGDHQPSSLNNTIPFAKSSTQGGSQAPASMQSIFSAFPALATSESSTGTASFSAFGAPSFFSVPLKNTIPFAKSSSQGGSQAPASMQSIFSAFPALATSESSTGTASFSAFGALSFFSSSYPSAKSQCQGTRVASYVATPETEVKEAVTSQDHKIVSISAMLTYKYKSHEELRLEDYQLSREKAPAVNFPSAPSVTTFTFGKSDGHESLNPQSHFGQVIGTNQELGTRIFRADSHASAKPQCQGTRVASYVATPETEVKDDVTTQADDIVSISAMPTYKDKSHEELRLEDYQLSKEKAPAVNFPSAPSVTTFTFGKSDGHKSLSPQSHFGQVIGTNQELGTRIFSAGCHTSAKPLCQGTRVASYVATPETDVKDAVTTQADDIISISAMPTYKDKSHEELRLEDYQLSKEKAPAVNFPSAPSVTTFTFGKSDGHESLSPESHFGQVIGTNQELGTRIFSAGCHTSAKPLCQGTRVASYVATPETDVKDAVTTQADDIISISAMPTYKDKSHEELRLEDYQLSKEKAPAVNFPSAPSVTTFTFGKSDGHESLSPQSHFSQVIGTNQELGTRIFSAGCHTSAKPLCQGTRVASYVATPETDVKDAVTTQADDIISISAMPTYKDKSHEELRLEDYQLSKEKGITSGFSSDMNNILSSKFQSLETQVGTANTLSKPTLAHNEPEMLRKTSPGLELKLGVAPLFKTELSFSSNSASTSISNQPSADPNAGTCSQKINLMQSASHSNPAIGGLPITNPFRGEPTLQISVDSPVSNIAIQYGISSLSVNDNPSPIKRTVAAVRHRSLNRNRLTVKKYKPERDHKKVPFFQEGLPDAYKLKAPFIPRENPKAWLRNPTEEQSPETKTNKSSVLENKSSGIHDTEISNEANKEKDDGYSPEFSPFLNGIFDNRSMHIISKGHQADEAATLCARVPDVQRMMPKLQCPEYYTIPSIDELVTKEKGEPGFCRCVKDFIVGRYGYGSIKFLGETDVRNLDLESVVKLKYREVIVYMDEIHKPPVGQGLNKPAEITLLNVKCMDKSTGKLYVDGPMVDKYRQILIKKGAKQGVEFVSYDPISGEWKFRVPHF